MGQHPEFHLRVISFQQDAARCSLDRFADAGVEGLQGRIAARITASQRAQRVEIAAYNRTFKGIKDRLSRINGRLGVTVFAEQPNRWMRVEMGKGSFGGGRVAMPRFLHVGQAQVLVEQPLHGFVVVGIEAGTSILDEGTAGTFGSGPLVAMDLA